MITRAQDATCAMTGTMACPTATPGSTALPTPATTDGTGGLPGSARQPRQQPDQHAAPLIPPAALPYLVGALALFVAVWWDVPGRLVRRYRNSPGGRARVRDAERRREAEALRAAAVDADAENAPPAIASIDPGLAATGMRVGVRGCEVALRAGPDGTIALDKMLAGTGDKEFTRACRVVRGRLADPEFVGDLITATGRAVYYLEVNPHFPGARERRAELLTLSGALERVGNGLSD